VAGDAEGFMVVSSCRVDGVGVREGVAENADGSGNVAGGGDRLWAV